MRLHYALLPLIAGVLAGCSSTPKEAGRANECMAYTAPPGWLPSPSKLTGDLKLTGPDEFPIGNKFGHDSFTVDYLPYKGSLDAFRVELLAAMNQRNLDRAIALHANDNPAIEKIESGVPESVVTATTLGGRPAFRLENRNTIMMDSTPVTTVNTTVYAKFGEQIILVTVGYFEQREAQVKPLAAPFLASINFDRCK